MNRPRHPDRRHRPGFTLVEILVVITILGILVALLVPVIAGAVGTARNAQVTGEINTMAAQLASFKSRYGDFPPSRILLREDGVYDTSSSALLNTVTFYTDPTLTGKFLAIGDPPNWYKDATLSGSGKLYDPAFDLTYGQLAERSVRFLRKFFPRSSFKTSTPGLPATYGVFHDFNGNGTADANPILLQGHECLVFFLGGIPIPTIEASGATVTFGMAGFANNPQNPFVNDYTTLAATKAAATNRQPALFPFRSEQLIDDDFDGMPGYIDPLGRMGEGRYYAYFSSYGGGGYDPNDVNFALVDDAIRRPFRVNFTAGTTGTPTNVVVSPVPNPYTSSPAVPPPPRSQAATFQANDSYQIISAGRDRLYGYAGQYAGSTAATPLALDPTLSTDAEFRIREADNLSSFTNGKLQ